MVMWKYVVRKYVVRKYVGERWGYKWEVFGDYFLQSRGWWYRHMDLKPEHI